MSKKAGIFFMIAGAVLILSALSLYLYNANEDVRAGQNAEYLLRELQAVIAENGKTTDAGTYNGPTPPPLDAQEPTPSSPEITETLEQPVNGEENGNVTEEETIPEETPPPSPTFQIDGENYIGIVSIPSLKIILPVMNDWDYERLKSAPCRQFGSIETDDLVIAAHNYTSHFGKLGNVKPGAEVTFTEMDGTVIAYTVKKIVTLAETNVESVQNSGHDLALYTCTLRGDTRLTVFCDRVETGE